MGFTHPLSNGILEGKFRMKIIFFLFISIVLNSTRTSINAQLHNYNDNKYRIDKKQKIKNISSVLLAEVKKPNVNVPRVLTYIKSGADLETHSIVAGVQYYTPLQYAARLHHWKTVNVLVTNGANTNPAVPYGDEHYLTPLMHCALSGQLSVVKILLRHGADVNAKGYHDLTALMLAAQSGQKDIVKTLLKSGADISATSYFSHETALAFARHENHNDIAKLLQKMQ